MSLRPTDEEVESLRREGLPVVLVDVVHPALPRVVIDDTLGGTMATEHLLARGHTKIGFVGDAPSPFGFTSSERRRQGMARALRRAGITRNGATRASWRRMAVSRRASLPSGCSLPDRPTAIFAASDVQAMGVLEAARAMGLRVPEDLAVIGFDDIEVAEVLGLTTVHQPLRETGRSGGRPPARRRSTETAPRRPRSSRR